MAANNSINNDIKVAVGTSLNLSSSTTINGVINDGTMATASATTLATSSSVKTYATGKNRLLQSIYTQTGVVSSASGNIPYDDSIPQISEGNVYLGISITPKNSANLLLVNVVMNSSLSGSNTATIALYTNTGPGALCAVSANIGAGTSWTLPLMYYMTAGTTSAIDFYVYAGGDAGTHTMNGVGGSRLLGGAFNSYMLIQEFGVQ